MESVHMRMCATVERMFIALWGIHDPTQPNSASWAA